MKTVVMINFIISIVFSLCYLYQILYFFVPFIRKTKSSEAPVVLHKFAVLISARNEEAVISNLIHDIRTQNYPSDLVTVFVVADNCTDNTAQVARDAGAVVWERFNKKQVGKGYALDFLISTIYEYYPRDAFDAFFVFDADNLLDENYIAEMNKTFSEGHRIITSYRNSKNYGTNWISAGYSLWFLRESKYLNYSRMLLGTSCAVSGTGFLVAKEVIEKNDGWKFFLLTEDIEFSVNSIINGERIAFCKNAVLYDEQPITFKQSWNQRLRWAKGFLQVFRKYGSALGKAMFKRRSFACFDMMMIIMPAIFITLTGVLSCLGAVIFGTFSGAPSEDVHLVVNSLVAALFSGYMMYFAAGAVTLFTEWDHIHSSKAKKIGYLFTFPVFMFTYIPIALAALVKHVEWKPIQHTEVRTLADVRGEIKKAG